MSENSTVMAKASVKELVSVIDRAWEAKRAVQLVQLMLFLDLAMMMAGQPSLLAWDSKSTPVLGNLNFVIITLVSFTIYAALLTPFAGSIAAVLVISIPKITFFIQEVNYERPHGHVSLEEYKKDAYAKNDKDMIAHYLQTKAHAHEASSEQRQSGHILFGTVILILMNVLLSFDTSDTLLQATIGFIGQDIALLIGFFLLIGFWRAITTAWFYHPVTWIEHPELYRELESKRRAESDYSIN